MQSFLIFTKIELENFQNSLRNLLNQELIDQEPNHEKKSFAKNVSVADTQYISHEVSLSLTEVDKIKLEILNKFKN